MRVKFEDCSNNSCSRTFHSTDLDLAYASSERTLTYPLFFAVLQHVLRFSLSRFRFASPFSHIQRCLQLATSQILSAVGSYLGLELTGPLYFGEYIADFDLE